MPKLSSIFKQSTLLIHEFNLLENIYEAKNNLDCLIVLEGKQLSYRFILNNGFEKPILIESINGLGLKTPDNKFTSKSLLEYFSNDHKIDVIDVENQKEININLTEFVDIFSEECDNRNYIYNCLSLEISKSELTKQVEVPDIVNKLCWVINYWPNVDSKPLISKYCIMSMKESFTNFHVDFGGTSVWYHILKGEKIFYLIQPTEINLNKYKQWESNKSNKNFSNYVEKCFKLKIKAGQTLFIPSGWIHAVHTTQDSIVFGGKFLHSFNIEMQIKINEMEKSLKIASKYRFPYFELTNWYASPNVLKQVQENMNAKKRSLHLIDGLNVLVNSLKSWLIQSEKKINYYERFNLAPYGINHQNIIEDVLLTLKKSQNLDHKMKEHKKIKVKLIMTEIVKEFDFKPEN